jgi:fatty acyl-CoA reductase
LHGWPNTYVFTKAMGEMLIVNQKDNIALIIIRPTMVTGTIRDPFPGWIEGVRYIIFNIDHKCFKFVSHYYS